MLSSRSVVTGIRQVSMKAAAFVPVLLICMGGVASCSTARNALDSGPVLAAKTGGQALGVLSAETQKLKDSVSETMTTIAEADPRPAQEALRSGLILAGIDKANLEVSPSKTPTGLDVDSIEAAARHGSDCIMGQIRDGTVYVTVLPVLANGRCFLGEPENAARSAASPQG